MKPEVILEKNSENPAKNKNKFYYNEGNKNNKLIFL